MTHLYYEQDSDMNNEARLKYFDQLFKSYAQALAKEKGITVSSYLSQITNITSFKAVLQEVFSLDASLSNYVSGFSQRSFRLFYDRPIIQEIVKANKKEDEEFFEEIQKEIPVSVEQIAKETAIFFKGEFKEKETGKIIKVIAKEDSVVVRGKAQVRYRDSHGKFVRKV